MKCTMNSSGSTLHGPPPKGWESPPSQDEIWRPVAGVPDWALGYFEISNYGRCRRAPGVPTYHSTKPGRLLKPRIINTNYFRGCRPRYSLFYTLKNKGQKLETQASQLVAKAFIPNNDPEHKTEVNHIDGNAAHNWVENLEWVTSRENKSHALKEGLNSTSGFVRLTDKNGKRRFFFSRAEASEFLGRERHYIYKCTKYQLPVRDAAGNFYALEVIPREKYQQNPEEYDRDL